MSTFSSQMADELTTWVAAVRTRCSLAPRTTREQQAIGDVWLSVNAVEAVLSVHPLRPDGWCATCASPRAGDVPARVAQFGCLTRAVIAQAVLKLEQPRTSGTSLPQRVPGTSGAVAGI